MSQFMMISEIIDLISIKKNVVVIEEIVTEIVRETEIGIEIETVTEIEIVTVKEKGIAILNAEGAKKSAGKETSLAQAKLTSKTIGTKRINLEHHSKNATPKMI